MQFNQKLILFPLALAGVALTLSAQHSRGPAGMSPDGGPGMFRFLSAEGRPGKLVTGAPYSATAVTTTTRTLGDGSHITNTSTTTLYRDSQGRTRREQSMSGVGPWPAAGGQATKVIFIDDPVSGESAVLRPETKTAQKFTKRPARTAETARTHEDPVDPDVQVTQLPAQTIAGVSATGTRTTRTIAVGKIGNDKVLTSVRDKWYSPDLQITVQSSVTDPQFGNSSYTLQNVSRAEPAASLFQVPADYTVSTSSGPGGPGGGFDRESRRQRQ